jgi:tight adherence protein C
MNFSEIIGPDGISEDIIIAIAALAAFINVFLIYRVMLVRDPNASRIKELNERMHDLKQDATGPRRRSRREQSIGLMRTFVNRFNLLRSHQANKASLALSRAGWRGPDALNIYFFLKLCLPFVFGGGAILALFVAQMGTFDTPIRLIIALFAVVIGAYAPDVFVNNAATKRKTEITKGLPDSLDLLVICAEAGQSLDAALTRIAAEMNTSCPEIADEIRLTALELGLLPDRRQALTNLDNRTNVPGIRGVVNTLNQTEKYGTPLAQSLRVLATEFRSDRMMKAETKAAKLPAVMTVPMIIFILPPLFIVLIGPAILSVMDMLGTL